MVNAETLPEDNVAAVVLMLIDDLLRTSLRQIFRNRRRYRGAILGMALGIGGLITVLTLGDSVESSLGQNLDILGSATIVKAQWDSHKTARTHDGEYSLKDVDDLSGLPGVLTVAPAVWGPKRHATYQKKKTLVSIVGVGPSFFQALYMPMAAGRAFTPEDVNKRRPVCIIGKKVRDELFGPHAAFLNESLVIDGRSFQIVGLLGGTEDPDHIEMVMLPISVAIARIEGMHRIRDIYVRAKDWDSVPTLHLQVSETLKRNQPGLADGMNIVFYKERVRAVKTIAFLFKFFLWCAIVVTIFLGGLGITNIMLVAVKERTREIGLRKSVGATESMIVVQFLCEAVTAGMIGAFAGIFAGGVAVQVLTQVFKASPTLQTFLLSVFVAVVLGVGLGVASGVLPARVASRMDPVEAMRFE